MPKQSPIESQIRSLTESFTSELALLVRQSALQSVVDALGETVTSRRVTARPTARGPRRLAKRSPEQVLALAAKLHAAVKAKPGQTIEQLGKDLRMPTAVLKLPATKLLESKKVKTKGQKRGTKYFAV
jgi:hypothetical protein